MKRLIRQRLNKHITSRDVAGFLKLLYLLLHSQNKTLEEVFKIEIIIELRLREITVEV